GCCGSAPTRLEKTLARFGCRRRSLPTIRCAALSPRSETAAAFRTALRPALSDRCDAADTHRCVTRANGADFLRALRAAARDVHRRATDSDPCDRARLWSR